MAEEKEEAVNMYGCLPCPRCGSRYRWPTVASHAEHPSSIVCDDCGLVQKYAVREDGNFADMPTYVAAGE